MLESISYRWNIFRHPLSCLNKSLIIKKGLGGKLIHVKVFVTFRRDWKTPLAFPDNTIHTKHYSENCSGFNDTSFFLFFRVTFKFIVILFFPSVSFSFVFHTLLRLASPPVFLPCWAFNTRGDATLPWNKNFCIIWSSESIVILDPGPAFSTQIVD